MTRSLERHAKRVKLTKSDDGTKSVEVNGYGLINGYRARRQRDVNSENGEEVSEQAIPAQPRHDAISKATLEARKRANDPEIGRRSLRQKLDKQRDADDTELTIYLRNIRKKLNWKTNKIPDPNRPRKRARLRDLPCHAHLTIWAHNPHARSKEDEWPLMCKSTAECTMDRGEPEINTVKGRFIELKMRQPFRVSKQNLVITMIKNGERVVQMAPEYSMEIKIVPVHVDADWPPIPLLTRPAQEAKELDDAVRTDLQDCLVANYKKLPTAPEAQTPLSVRFLSTVTMETKYGLELDATWGSPEPKAKPEGEDDDLSNVSWLARFEDDDASSDVPNHANHANGAVNGLLNGTDRSRTGTPVLNGSRLARKSTRPRNRVTPTFPTITYVLHPIKDSQKESKPYRMVTIQNFRCQACPRRPFKSIETLLHHLNLLHNEQYTLEARDKVAIEDQAYTIRVEKHAEKGVKRRELTDEDHEEEFLWLAPPQPFDINKHYIEEDRSWFGEAFKPKKKKPVATPAIPDPSATKRKQNHGHLLPQDVLPLRPSTHKRKEYKIPVLKRRNPDLRNPEPPEPPFASISFRELVPDQDSDRSETDDEADETPFIARHLEELDVYAREQHFTSAEHKLARKWDYHILHRERLVSSRFLSDALVRFVRIERQWFHDSAKEDPLMELAWMDMIAEFVTTGSLTEEAAAELHRILYLDDVALPAEELAIKGSEAATCAENKAGVAEISENIKIEGWKLDEAQRTNIGPVGAAGSVPSDICWVCEQKIDDAGSALRCSNLSCKAPNLWCHAVCGGVKLPRNNGPEIAGKRSTLLGTFIKERASWKCGFCNPDKEKRRERFEMQNFAYDKPFGAFS